MKKEKEKKSGIWLTVLLVVLLLPILVINLIIIIKANKNPDDVPEIFGYKPLIVMSLV